MIPCTDILSIVAPQKGPTLYLRLVYSGQSSSEWWWEYNVVVLVLWNQEGSGHGVGGLCSGSIPFKQWIGSLIWFIYE